MEAIAVVYGSPLGSLLMVPREEAIRARAIIFAFKNAKNWGDFKALMPDHRSFLRYARHSRHFSGPIDAGNILDLIGTGPKPDEPFEAWDAYGEIDPENLPYYPEHEMLGWLPNEVIRMGEVVNLIRRGHIRIQVILEFSPNDTIPILTKMRELGYQMNHDEDLIWEITAIDIDLRK